MGRVDEWGGAQSPPKLTLYIPHPTAERDPNRRNRIESKTNEYADRVATLRDYLSRRRTLDSAASHTAAIQRTSAFLMDAWPCCG